MMSLYRMYDAHIAKRGYESYSVPTLTRNCQPFLYQGLELVR